MKTPCSSAFLLLAMLLPVAAGCPGAGPEEPASPANPPGPQRTLQVLVIDDDDLAEAIQRQWQARSDTPLELHRATTAEAIADGESSWNADVVVFPSGLLGEFAERERIVPLGKRQLDAESFARQDVFEVLRRGETTWGKESLAVSLGSPQLTLMYRVDIFESLGLAPPTTWPAYQQLVDRLADRDALGDHAPPADQPWAATREPLGEGWAGQLLLARAAAYVRHPHQYSTLFDLRDMRPLIDGAPFVKALDELVQATSPAAEAPGAEGRSAEALFLAPGTKAPRSEESRLAEARAATPAQVRADFLAGRCAMALTWPSHADAPSGDQSSGQALQVGFVQLPGSPDVFNFRNQAWEAQATGETTSVPLLAVAGRLAALTRTGRRSSAANTMLLWLGGNELGGIVSPASSSTTLFRGSLFGVADRWVNPQLGDQAAREYAELVRHTQNQSIWLSSVRIPGRQRYLAALDQAVWRALDGQPAQEALAAAAIDWQRITDELGRDEQKSAYTRSIGLEP